MENSTEDDFMKIFKDLQEKSGESIKVSGGLVTCKSKNSVFICNQDVFFDAMSKAGEKLKLKRK